MQGYSKGNIIRLLIFIILKTCPLYPCISDSTKERKSKKIIFTKEISAENFGKDYTAFSTLDTSLTEFQRYKAKNDLGNIGLAINPISPALPKFSAGFNYMPSAYETYLFNHNNRRFYKTIAPFTELYFFVGAKKEQGFRFIHTQNVNKNLNFSASFNRVRSEGFYTQQQTNHNNFSITSNYVSPKKKYFLLSAICYNKLNNNENGGLQNDSTFEVVSRGDRKLIAINLSDANRTQRNKSIFLKQFFNTGRKELINSDSSGSYSFIPRNSFIHTVSAEDNSSLYSNNNPMSGFHKNIFSDSIKTYDSVYYYTIKNEIKWQNLKNKTNSQLRKLGGSFGFRQEYTRFADNGLDTTFQNITAIAECFSISLPKTSFSLQTEYIISGVYKNNVSARLKLKMVLKDSMTFLSINGSYKEYAPDFIFNHYQSNHFKWTNSFNKQTTASSEVLFSSMKYHFSLGVRGYYYSNFIYLDSAILPSIYAEAITILCPFIEKNFIFNKIHFSNRITYQQTSEPSVIHLSKIISCNSLYYENSIFKKALYIQAGIDILYYSSFFSNAYEPALGLFYLQDRKKTGNYPFVDVFINMKIKTARIFLKYEHINSGLMGYRYYGAPSYPLPDRAFKFGISWMMFN